MVEPDVPDIAGIQQVQEVVGRHTTGTIVVTETAVEGMETARNRSATREGDMTGIAGYVMEGEDMETGSAECKAEARLMAEVGKARRVDRRAMARPAERNAAKAMVCYMTRKMALSEAVAAAERAVMMSPEVGAATSTR